MNKNRIKNWGITSILILAIVVFLYTTQIKANYIYSYVRHKQIENNDEINLLCDAYGVTLSDNIIGVEYIDEYNSHRRTGMVKFTIRDVDAFFSENAECQIFILDYTDGTRNEIMVNYRDIVINPNCKNYKDESVVVYGTSYDVRIIADDNVSREGDIIFSYDEDGNMTICFYVWIDSNELRDNVISIREKYYYDEFSSYLESL